MTFVAPGWIALGALASIGIVAIHLIAWRVPRTILLPTARFVPDEPSRRAARALRLSDVALLMLRIGVVMTGGFALARPTFAKPPSGQATVVAMERSQAIADVASMRESVRGVVPAGQRVTYVVFDTTVRTFNGDVAAFEAVGDSAAPVEASLTVGLLGAIREAQHLRREYEDVRIVIASTFTRGAFDEATPRVRNTWSDSLHLLRVAARLTPPRPGIVTSRATIDDPIIAGIRLAEANGLIHGTSSVVRDSVWPSVADSGATLVLWPRSAPPSRVDGVHAGGYTAIGHFIPGAGIDSGRVIARWVNGAPAAWEVMENGRCVRRIGFDVPDEGDFTLTPSFQRVVAQLLRPCLDDPAVVAADSVIAELSSPRGELSSPRSSSRQAVSRERESSVMPNETSGSNRLAASLMVLAVALSMLEVWFRRRSVLERPA